MDEKSVGRIDGRRLTAGGAAFLKVVGFAGSVQRGGNASRGFGSDELSDIRQGKRDPNHAGVHRFLGHRVVAVLSAVAQFLGPSLQVVAGVLGPGDAREESQGRRRQKKSSPHRGPNITKVSGRLLQLDFRRRRGYAKRGEGLRCRFCNIGRRDGE